MKKIETILLVDDDIDDREIFKEAMERVAPSVQCFSAVDGEDAMLILDSAIFTPDLIFLDLNMPRLNGIQCLIEIKKNQKIKDIPVIIYSTSTLAKDVDETKELGASQYIVKPYGFPELCQSLTEAMELELKKN